MTDQADGPGAETLEVERKYEAGVELRLPDAEAFRAAGFEAGAPVVQQLSARYFDTPEGDLARRGFAVRSRHGGKDAGWHMKQRTEGGNRELLWPHGDEMPAELRREIEARIGVSPDRLVPIAALETRRTTVVLRHDGREVVELADDRVRAREGATGVRRAWREWEAELLPGAGIGADAADPEGAALLDRVEAVLLAAGATPSLSFAKIARATGQLVAVARAKGASEELLAALQRLDASDQRAARSLEP
ncbi:CYTH domain-containing protein [Leucobacter muris]|uniref:CYTH domain-containing protein n=1 Tax=Leucobacter muris TaxID=1935379 RepID=UPI0013E2CFED|nr:CYTH domain-containing protein [Leucobacter muris]